MLRKRIESLASVDPVCTRRPRATALLWVSSARHLELLASPARVFFKHSSTAKAAARSSVSFSESDLRLSALGKGAAPSLALGDPPSNGTFTSPSVMSHWKGMETIRSGALTCSGSNDKAFEGTSLARPLNNADVSTLDCALADVASGIATEGTALDGTSSPEHASKSKSGGGKDKP
ncbi:hypothetical protein ACHAXT_008307 [Thalassiosira profunda]